MKDIIKNIFYFILISAILINLFIIKLTLLGILLGIIYIILFGFLLGKIIFKKQNFSFQIILGSFILICLYSFLGSIEYYFHLLDQISVSGIFILISVIILFLNFQNKDKYKFNWHFLNQRIIKGKSFLLIIAYLLLFISSLIILFKNQTTDPINSPWQILPTAFFIVYFLASINLILVILYNKNFFSNILIAFHFFLTASIALIIYQLGFGFDPFIHQATENAIFNQGLILPKPFYYLGQYSVVVIFAHLFQISIEWIDKLLLPLLITLILPYAIFKSLSLSFKWPKYICRLLSLSFLVIPFTLFIVTTPQALANIIAIITLFLSFLYLKKQLPFFVLIIPALTSLAIHALAGLPILIYLIILFLINSKIKFKTAILSLTALISSIILPLALIINSQISINKASFNFEHFQLPQLISKEYNYFLDLAYLYQNSIYLILILIAGLAAANLIKHKQFNIFISSFITFIILIINSFLLKFINLSNIINYEQTEFSSRTFQLSFYFLLPLIIYGFYLLIKKTQKKKLAYILLFLLPAILTITLYLSYPRFDNYQDSKFINMTHLDLMSVELIELNADNQDYIVLANQMTSAAALKKFGFTKYYNEQYFYPIPTGSKMYQYFLKMLYQQTDKQTVNEAMDFAGVDLAYIILPKYWFNSKNIAAKIQEHADQTIILLDNYYIFKFIR